MCKSKNENLNIVDFFRTTNKGSRFITVEVNLKGGVKLALTCLHLEHRREPTRLSEIKGIKNALDKANINHDCDCQIWTGDFNALTKEDYSPEEWAEITNVRQKNSWELPKTELTTQVQQNWGTKYLSCM